MSKARAAIQRVIQSPLFLQQGFIGGRWCGAKSGATFPVYNPANNELIGQVPDMSEEDALVAINSANDAFQKWKKTTSAEKSTKLRRWFDLIVKNQEDIAGLMTLEMGKPLIEARGELTYGASFVEWFAEEAKRIYGDLIPSPIANRRLMTIKQPVGVSALWTPWNFPVAMITRKVAPALAAGCTVIIKPSEETPYTALALAKLAEEAGFPAGSVNVLTCVRDNASKIADVIAENDTVRKFSFTGSTATGKALMTKCIQTIKRISVELGGNAPFLVFDSADVDAAVAGTMASKFRNAGQTCVCANRILVQEGIYDEYAAKLAESMKKELKVGNGFEDGVTQGPLINEGGLLKVERHISDALSKGAKLELGGKRVDRPGHFFEPTLITGITEHMDFCHEETFGPVAPLIKFKTEEEAVAIANSLNAGLAGYAYTNDLAQAWRVAEDLEAGLLGINEGIISTVVAPFGGVKESGIGREGSKYGIDEYLEVKYVCMGGLKGIDS